MNLFKLAALWNTTDRTYNKFKHTRHAMTMSNTRVKEILNNMEYIPTFASEHFDSTSRRRYRWFSQHQRDLENDNALCYHDLNHD